MRIDRLLAITVMLINRKRVTAKELADYFEVSVRTIYRDIEAIDSAGIPVISFQGNTGGFGIMEEYKIDRQLFTFNDMLAILSTLKGINTTLEDKEINSAIEKITSLVPKEKTDQLKLHYEQIVFDILPWGQGKKQKDKMKVVHYSLSHNRLVRFTYRSTKGEKINRTVEPMTLIFKGFTWYLFAYCQLREDYRLFRVNRMSSIENLNDGFIRKNMSYQNYFQTENQDMKFVYLILKFLPQVRVFVEDYFEEDQISIQDDGSIIVKAAFPEDQWTYSHILSYGEYVEVLQPAHVRDIILEKAQKTVQIYQSENLIT